jgi:glucokinase
MAPQPVTGSSVALAIDLGGTQLRAALVDASGSILCKLSRPTLADAGPAKLVEQIAALAGAVIGESRSRPPRAAGISSPGPIDTIAGVALGIPTLRGFHDFPLRTALAEALALPVVLENDGIAAAIGEWRFGAGRGFADLVYVTVSTGIGGGVIAGNRVLRGRRGMAAHVGHMSFMAGGEHCFCGNRGCFEAYASGSAFAARAAREAAVHPSTRLGRGGAPVSAPEVFAAAAAGDDLAARLVAEEARLLGLGFASLLHLYDPQLIIVGGGLSQQFHVLEAGIAAAMRGAAMPAFRDTPVVKAALGVDSGLLGAAALAFGNY